ncbi:MAG: multidrug efflux RND transporter permease subunit [Gemmatales bacterium]|nr:MAG: multidrug efflux RND transporter permease subunit [Gemmatales bacterium]
MISRFFINRPIGAAVLAIVIVIVGGVALRALPIAQYPEITPPTVKVTTSYPGANAQVLADTVAAPIEQQVNGVEGMIYMSSTSANDGTYNLTVTFAVGTDLDMAQVLVQNRVSIALPQLPEEVKRQGVITKKQSTSILLFIALSSPDGSFDSLQLTNYASQNIKDELARIPGVGDVAVFGAADYSMRVWLDPNKLETHHVTASDVINAISAQNVQVAAGQIGQPPAAKGQAFQYTINVRGRLKTPEEFGDIVVRTAPDAGGQYLRVRDLVDSVRFEVAPGRIEYRPRIELGGKDYSQFSEKNGRPAASIAVYQLPGANALEVADKVRDRMTELSERFPQGITYDIPFDTTRFVTASIDEVYETLYIAAALVFLVVYVFLQDLRSTLIPAITIPVSLIGTFAVMAALGFSLNMLTLFGLVLAIGIVVDDAIVVVENTTRHIEEGGLSSKEATIKAMEEVTGPVIATTLVLMSVFIPSSFQPGITGQLYRQFALTIAASTFFSSINALTLSPALCALLLRPPTEKRFWFFRGFNRIFMHCENFYEKVVGHLARRTILVLILFVALIVAAGWGFITLPTGFLPEEDQGYVVAGVQLPDAASQERTRQVVDKINEMLAEQQKSGAVADWITIGGYSLLDSANASNAATVYIVMKPWDERTDERLQQKAVVQRLRQEFARIRQGIVFVVVPPAIQGLGVAGGFQMQIQDRAAQGMEELQVVVDNLMDAAARQSGLAPPTTTFRANVPQIFADVNRTKVMRLGIPLSEVFGTMQAYLGSAYVNDFNLAGRTYQVRVQADYPYRVKVEDIDRLYVRNKKGEMVPLSTVVSIRRTVGPQIITRYNLYPSAAITGEAAPGYSSGEALSLMEQLAKAELPPTMGFEWTGMSYQEKQIDPAVVAGIFALAVVLVYLVLAFQYESWTMPAAVILSVPLALLGAVAAVAVRQMDNNTYTQIGIVLLIALASKNAILIVEFASEIRHSGAGIIESAIRAARLRFRPILMTSFAFILGVVPLVIAQGAGAGSRQALGTAVFGGMIAATFLSVLFVPSFFILFRRISEFGKEDER